MTVKEKIHQTIRSNPVVLYMKGTADFPECGFSGRSCADSAKMRY